MEHNLQLTLDLPMSEAARQILLFQLSQLSAAARAACAEDEQQAVDGVHDLRVAVRRSITALDGFSPWLDAQWRKQYGRGFRPLLKSVGRLRDLDVLVANMEAEAVSGQSINQVWLDKARQKRDRLRQELSPHVSGKPFLKWLAGKSAALNRSDAGLCMEKPPIGKRGRIQMHCMNDSLPVLLAQAAAGLTVFHQAIPQPQALIAQASPAAGDLAGWSEYSQEVLHQLRLSAKHFRYCLEFAMAVPGFRNQDLLDLLKQLQDALGTWHDAVFACEWGWALARKRSDDQALISWLSRQQAKKMAAQEDFELIWARMTAFQVSHLVGEALAAAFNW